LVTTGLALAAMSSSAAQTVLPDSTTRRVDSLFSRFKTDGPGCALGVFQGGRIAYEHGYGSANIEYGIPITPRTPFIMGSLSKQFTAAAIALLVERGRLSLDDDVRKYVPELPDYGHPVTIDELVHHTSGVRDFWALVDAAGMRFDDGYTVADVVRLAARQQHLNFVPGTEYNYSNTGYVLLGVVVQRVTGMTLRQFAANEIFTPLGMSDSHYHDDHNEPVRGRAIAYMPAGDKLDAWRIDVWNNDIVGQGGVMTTVEDLQKWDENFYSGKVGGPAFLARQLTRGKLANGTTLAYAFGLEVGEYRGVSMVEHTGSTGGYRTDITRFPGEHASVVTLCNTTTGDAGALAHRVADIVLATRFSKPVPAATRAATTVQAGTAVTVPATELAALAGRYHSVELDATYVLSSTARELVVRRPRGEVDTLRATERDMFRTRGYSLRFVSMAARAAGSPPRFALDNGRARGIEFVREP
jgi:CubicO group peptidase (beta-lactamase class C family)